MTNFRDTIDATVWTDGWLKTLRKYPGVATDRNTMLGWFSTAIMAGYDAGQKRSVTGNWLHVIAYFKDHTGLAIAMPLAQHLLEGSASHLYFATYTGKPGLRVELKMVTRLSRSKLVQQIRDFCRLKVFPGEMPRKNRNPIRIVVKPFTGSLPHALAMQVAIALEMQGLTKDTLKIMDVVHWLYNMAGFSYLQESEACLRQAHRCLMNSVSGWRTTPAMPNPAISYKPKRKP